jgi:hypothetical protein
MLGAASPDPTTASWGAGASGRALGHIPTIADIIQSPPEKLASTCALLH